MITKLEKFILDFKYPVETEDEIYAFKRLYGIYNAMKRRCENIKCQQYKWYGGKGIVICDKWNNSFLEFAEWSYKNGYKEYLTIDRVDSNGNYEPDNCQWITKSKNSRRRHKGTEVILKNKYGNIFAFKYLAEAVEKTHVSAHYIRKIINKEIKEYNGLSHC